MANTLINVNPDLLDSAAIKVDEYTKEYERLSSNLYLEIEKMNTSWNGKDNIAYTNQILNYKKNMIRISEVLKQYTQCLKACARSYRETQDEIVSRASKL